MTTMLTRALVRAEKAEAERDALRGTVDALKTEAGKAAFALSNGWPLPEEVAALRADLAAVQCAADGLRQCCEEQRAEVERLRAKSLSGEQQSPL